MNTDEESPSTATAHWLPSHVRITVHKAKDLHLKNKSGSSEVYVRIESDQRIYPSSAVPKQTAPSWNEDIIIPLMSLVTTIHIQVRQRGRFGDKYLGYLPISPGNFKVSPNTVTHWYKLGPKPGKSSSKLRGDLQISFQFLSKWSEKQGRGLETGMQDGLLRRSSSDRKIWNGNGVGPDIGSLLAEEQQQSQSKNKKELLSSLRRSFKRKSKPSGGTQNGDKDFFFTGADISPLPQYVPKKSSAVNVMRSNSISLGRPVSLGPLTDSESSLTSSPLLSRIIKRRSEEAILELTSPGGGEKGVGEREVGSPLSSSASESKLPTEQQFQYYISKKKRWNLPAKPVDSTSTTSSNSDLTAGKTSPIKEDQVEGTSDADPKSLQIDGSPMTPFTYRSRAAHSNSKSFRETSKSPQSNSDSRLVDEEGGNENGRGSESATVSSPTDDPAMGIQSSEASGTNHVEGTKVDEKKPPNPIKSSPVPKTHPYSRKIDITPRKSSSPSVERVLPRILSYEKSKDDSSPFSSSSSSPKPRNAQLKRRSTINNTSSRTRLLPATPVRRNTKTQLSIGNNLQLPSRSEGNSCRNSLCLIEDVEQPDAAAGGSSVNGGSSVEAVNSKKKLVNSSQDLSMCSKDGSGGRLTPLGGGLGEARKNTTPIGSTASIDGKTERPSTPKVKHTVQYRGFEPVSLLPPSLSDYTSRSHTLPIRGKHSKRSSDPGGREKSTPSTEKSEASAATAEKPQSAPPSQGFPLKTLSATPTNTKYLPRGSMVNLFTASQTPPTQKEASARDEVDDGKIESPNSLAFVDRSSVNAAKAGGWLSAPPMGMALSKEISKSTDHLPARAGYRSKVPGDIASSAKNRKPAGGIRKAMSLYQENKKQHVAARGRKGSSSVETAAAVGFPVENDCGRCGGGDDEKMLLVDADFMARPCVSEGNSPPLERYREMTGSFGSVFISSLKKTSTLLFTGAAKNKTQVSPDNGEDATDSTQHNSFHDNILCVDGRTNQKMSAPAILMRTLNPNGGAGSDEKSSEGELSDPAETSAGSPLTKCSSGGGDSSSVKTLTESDDRPVMDSTSLDIADQRHSPNPAGAAAASVGGGGGAHVRHTTASSVESEGFHSMASEDLGGEGWMTLPKEELVKELIRSKRKLKESEEDLKDVRDQLADLKSYLDNILLRVMETNPSILSSNHGGRGDL